MLRVMAEFLEVTTALEREAEYDIVFVDTEFTRLPLQKEHIRSWASSTGTISVSAVPLDGGTPFYAVQNLSKKLRAQCSDFVLTEVLPYIEAAEVTCRFSTPLQFKRAFAGYFKNRLAATERRPLIAVDWIGDAFLLEYMLPAQADILLLDQIPEVERSFEQFFTGSRRRHNAVHDAMALREGYLANRQVTVRGRADAE